MTNKPSIILIGAGGHARACIDVVEIEGRFAIAGMLGLSQEIGAQILGYSVLGADSDLPEFAQKVGFALVAIGQIKNPQPRMHLFQQLQIVGCDLPVIVSPNAYVSPHAKLGEGTIVMHGAIINAGAVIGQNCIINSNALIEHDACISNHCHISTAATINGGACVGEGCFIGSSTVVREGIRIGDRCLVGMGQRIMVDCGNDTQIPPR